MRADIAADTNAGKMTALNQSLVLFLLLLLTACQSKHEPAAPYTIDKTDKAYVMIEIVPGHTAGELVNTLNAVNAAQGYSGFHLSSSRVSSDTGTRDFLVMRGFKNFKAAEKYVGLLAQRHTPGNPFPVTESQFKECMDAMDSEQYRAFYRERR